MSTRRSARLRSAATPAKESPRPRNRSRSVSRGRKSTKSSPTPRRATQSRSRSRARVSERRSRERVASDESDYERELQELYDSENIVPDAAPSFFYRPHTITALLGFMAVGMYIAWTRHELGDAAHITQGNVKIGLLAGCAGFLLYCVAQLRDSHFVRPHPIVWRFVSGLSIIWMCFLSFLAFQNKHDVRRWLTYIDPDLGVPLVQQSYAENCDIYTPDHKESNFYYVREAIRDPFMIAHFLGYFGKTIAIRDGTLMWILSIFFELIELSMRHMLPNFYECWWDHLILDIMLCNGLGIYTALLCCRFFQMREYGWVGFWKTRGLKSKMKRMAGQFTPISWTPFHWNMTKSITRFGAMMLVFVMMNAIDMNSFFLKSILWIPPPHWVSTARLVMWWLITMPAVREYYSYISDPKCKRLGAQAWTTIACITLEIFIVIKWWDGEFKTDGWPPMVLWAWGIGIPVFIIWVITYFYGRRILALVRGN